MTRTLYEKRSRRYVPVAERDVFDAVGAGTWLVVVRPGSGMSATRIVDPASAEVEAAMHTARDAMVDAMRAQCAAGADSLVLHPHPPEARALLMSAWEAWRSIAGDVTLHFRGVSMTDVVDAGIEAVRASVKRDGDQ